MRLTGRLKFEQPRIFLRGPFFLAVLRHGALMIENRFRIQHREDRPVPSVYVDQRNAQSPLVFRQSTHGTVSRLSRSLRIVRAARGIPKRWNN
jgi:hypothetical protein